MKTASTHQKHPPPSTVTSTFLSDTLSYSNSRSFWFSSFVCYLIPIMARFIFQAVYVKTGTSIPTFSGGFQRTEDRLNCPTLGPSPQAAIPASQLQWFTRPQFPQVVVQVGHHAAAPVVCAVLAYPQDRSDITRTRS